MTITLTGAGTGTPLTLDLETHPIPKLDARPDGTVAIAVNGPAGPQIFRVQEDIDTVRRAISADDRAA